MSDVEHISTILDRVIEHYDKCNSSVSQHHHSDGDMHSLRQGRLMAGRNMGGIEK